MLKESLSKLADYIRENGKKSCRQLTEIFGRSKSSIHRKQQQIDRRSNIPSALFFESEDGQQYITKLVIAAIFVFGIMAGVGSERLALFFSLASVTSFVATSSSSVQRTEEKIDHLILKFKEAYDSEIKNKSSELEITPGG